METPVSEVGRSTSAGWLRAHADDVAVVVMFVTVRTLYLAWAGVRMDLGILGFAPHIPDLSVLQHHLLQTVFYEHIQPPLFPFLLGLVLKVSPFPDGITLEVVYLAQGLAFALVLRRVSRRMRLGRAAALVAIGLVISYPALVAIENLPTYDEPTILLLAVLVLFGCRYARSGRTFDLAGTATVAMALVLIRTVFHPVWFVLIIAGLLLIRRPSADRRVWVMGVVAPGLVIAACALKNDILYGQLSLTTWTGSSLSKIASSVVRPAETERLVRSAEVSPLFGRPVFYSYDTYADAMPRCHRRYPRVPVLAQPTRRTNGSPNLNDECQLPVYARQQKDAISFIRHHPSKFAKAELAGLQMYFEPPLPIIYTRNLAPLRHASDIFDRTVFLRLRLDPVVWTTWGDIRLRIRGGIDLVSTTLAMDLAAIGLGVVHLVRLRRGKRQVSSVAWVLVGSLVLWTTLAGSFFEINENARYRLLIDPFLIGTLAYVVESATKRVVQGARARAPAHRMARR